MYIKVCGMREATNIQAIDALAPDFLGFIFYPHSSRFVGKGAILPTNAQRVGVFVQESAENILACINAYHLQYVQLHGNESVAFVQHLRTLTDERVQFIKAFSVAEDFDFAQVLAYQPFCAYFLFDTQGAKHGGNGKKFNWDILKQYTSTTPFFLSGGITPEDAQAIIAFEHPAFVGIDINSGFEESPALKNVFATKQFIHAVRHQST
jgi:phosphoribosylanthranilate isomerase